MVATPHDFNYKRFNTLGPATRAQIDRQMPEWLRTCRTLVVSSDFMASELRHFYPEFADKVRVVRLGIPGGNCVPSKAQLEAYWRRMNLPQQFLLTVGWIVPHKNQKVLFDALGLLRQRGTSIPLVCVGPNSDQLQPSKTGNAHGYVAELLKLAETLGLKNERDFFGLGYVGDFELDCLYRLASALVIPSLYEAGSFPALEAVRAMCPVACSQIPAHIEQARLLGDNIWLFDPHSAENLADTIEQMLEHADVTAERARRASGLVGQVYSWQNAAAGYLCVFKEALQADASGSLACEGKAGDSYA
jgi:glycosyltransferase involved in cell wall biosynthesis